VRRSIIYVSEILSRADVHLTRNAVDLALNRDNLGSPAGRRPRRKHSGVRNKWHLPRLTTKQILK
jgi:hypothetical protein